MKKYAWEVAAWGKENPAYLIGKRWQTNPYHLSKHSDVDFQEEKPDRQLLFCWIKYSSGAFFFFFNMWRLSSNSVQDVYSWQHCSAYTASHWQSVFNVFHAHSLPVRQRSAITVLSPCIYSTEGLSDPSNVIKNYMPEQEFGSGHLSPSQPLPSDGFVSTHLALQQPRELLAL